MDETQIHHLSTSHIEPTLLGYLKNAPHISNVFKILWINSNKPWIYSWPQSEYMKDLLWLNPHFSNKIFRNLFKSAFIYSHHLHHLFFSWFSQKIFTSWNRFSQETMMIFGVGFPKSNVFLWFSLKSYFLKILFKGISHFLKNPSWFSTFQKTRFSGIQFHKFWISFSNGFFLQNFLSFS